MIVTQHSSPDLRNRCKWCGAKASGDGLYGEGLTCVPRNDHFTASEMRPEPARRQYAFEDAGTISARMREIEAERMKAANTDAEVPIADVMDTDCCG